MVPGSTDVMVPSSSIAFSEFIRAERASRPRNRPEPAARSQLILSAVASELARTLFAFASFIHGQGAAAQFLAIEGSDSGVAGGGIRHGDEAEAAGFTGHAISD